MQQGDPGQGLAHGPHFPGGGLLQGHPGGEAFQVPQAFQGLAPALAQEAVVLEKLHRIQAGVDPGQILEGIAQPLAQAPGSHGGDGVVQGFQQGPLAGAAAPGFEDLQVAQGGLIQAQKVVPAKG